MRVVVAVLLVVAEGLDAREVLQTLPGRVEQRLVDPEVVRVAVDVGDRPPEGDDLVAERGQERLEAVGLAVGLGQRLRIAQGARVASVRSKPGSACAISITAAE